MKRFYTDWRTIATLAVSLALPMAPAIAGVGKITSPLVSKGKTAVEYELQRYDDTSQDHDIELKYGLTDWLELALVTEASNAPGESFASTGHGGKFKTTLSRQADGYWLSSGVQGSFIHAREDNQADALGGKILLNRTQGNWDMGANLSVKRDIGAQRRDSVALSSAVDLLYSLDRRFSPGIEWHASYGPANDLRSAGDQEHFVGGVVYGTAWEQDKSKLHYVAGYARGITDESADDAWRLELEFSRTF